MTLVSAIKAIRREIDTFPVGSVTNEYDKFTVSASKGRDHKYLIVVSDEIDVDEVQEAFGLGPAQALNRIGVTTLFHWEGKDE